MYKPFISIVMPVYNGADYMREAIDSALAQTYDNIEIIVVNDGSNDNGETERIALSYGDKIRYYYKENGGCASALNYGISKMNGEYFSWLSHDDVYMPDKIRKQVECINTNNLSHESVVISCETYIINAEGKTMRKTIADYNGVVSANKAFEKNILGKCFNGCALLIPKEILKNIGEFSTTFVFILDWEYWIRIALNGYDFYCMNEPLVKNRRHNNQVSVKKKDLHDIEVEQLIYSLCNKIDKDPVYVSECKTLYYYCKMTSRKEQSDKLKKTLKSCENFKVIDSLKSFIYVIKRKSMKIFRAIYHRLVLRLRIKR